MLQITNNAHHYYPVHPILTFVLTSDNLLQWVFGFLCCCWWPFDGLGSGMGCVLEHLGCGVGGVIVSSCCMVDWMWALGCSDSPWENVHPQTGLLSWQLNLYLIVCVHHLDQYLIAIISVAQWIQHVTALVYMVHLSHWLIPSVAGGLPEQVGSGASSFTAVGLYWVWLPTIWVTAGKSAMCLAFKFSSGLLFIHLLSDRANLIYSLVPGVWHLANARLLLIKWAVVSCWQICHAMLKKKGLVLK